VADEERSSSSKGVDRRIDIQPAEDEDGKLISRLLDVAAFQQFITLCCNVNNSFRSRRRTFCEARSLFPLPQKPPFD